jgi:hypothetical protein
LSPGRRNRQPSLISFGSPGARDRQHLDLDVGDFARRDVIFDHDLSSAGCGRCAP